MRVGILTSGGDCQALNATMRGVGKSLYRIFDDPQIFGFFDGYKGLMYSEYKKMEYKDFSGILTLGGTILGTSRTPFKLIKEPDENGLNKIEAMKQTYRNLKLDCLVVLGGNGSLKTANLLSEEGLNVIGCPKTIDNDLWGTDMTFGFYSAVGVATNAIDCIHTTAASHGRVFIVEIMGHKVGLLTLYAGLAGGADIILIPEIPYDVDAVIRKINERHRSGSRFSIVAIAEGALSKEEAALTKKELKKSLAKDLKKYPSVAYKLADQIYTKTGAEVRVTVPGHTQRGGEPTPYDRVFATRVGAEAAKLIKERRFGQMVALQNNDLVSVPLKSIAGKLKTVDPKSTIVEEARMIGISFGDED